jgi:hypothetical protein
LPKEPTDAIPGTEEKIAILTRRAAQGEQLFHPEDMRLRPFKLRCGVVTGKLHGKILPD